MSAFRGKADVNHCVGECPLLAISGPKDGCTENSYIPYRLSSPTKLLRRVLLGVRGPDRLGAGLHGPPLTFC